MKTGEKFQVDICLGGGATIGLTSLELRSVDTSFFFLGSTVIDVINYSPEKRIEIILLVSIPTLVEAGSTGA